MAQKLILFEDIINGSAMKSNQALMTELGKLANYVFGESDFAIEKAAEKADDIQIWSGDELYKALANDYSTAFRFKSAFEIQAEGYAGPVMAWFFEPDGAFDDQIVVLTCESNGLFKNPRYVCDRLLGDFGGGDDDEDRRNPEDAGATVEMARTSDAIKEEKHLKPEHPKYPQMEYVDLGLSVKWAKWNLGAKAPEEIGDYFSWGELSPKSEYNRDNYKFKENGLFTKYNTKEKYGNVDNLSQLELSDDAAHQILGGDWRMPTVREAKELRDNCSLTKTTINGIKGWKFTSKKRGYTDKWIFLPDAGHMNGDKVASSTESFYWTSSLYIRRPDCGLMVLPILFDDNRSDRYDGLTIRPVTK